MPHVSFVGENWNSGYPDSFSVALPAVQAGDLIISTCQTLDGFDNLHYKIADGTETEVVNLPDTIPPHVIAHVMVFRPDPGWQIVAVDPTEGVPGGPDTNIAPTFSDPEDIGPPGFPDIQYHVATYDAAEEDYLRVYLWGVFHHGDPADPADPSISGVDHYFDVGPDPYNYLGDGMSYILGDGAPEIVATEASPDFMYQPLGDDPQTMELVFQLAYAAKYGWGLIT